MKTRTSLLIAGSLLFALTGLVPAQAAVDEEAAQALLKKSDCFKCHAIEKKKDGPAYKEVAKKYKGKADAEDKLVKHMTLKPMIEVDGKKEEHKAIKSSDPAEIKNAAQWILTR
ncbi:MAG: c-type cytochrome [Sulfuritalea sp.]|jgi:cytochrome c|nr:c-type cytochrome [Sulfuritalea sp.]